MNEKMLGARIAAMRKGKGWTQEELGEKLGLSAQAVSKWENDQSAPDISLLLPLAHLFGVSADALLGEEKPTVTYLAPEGRDIDSMMLRIIVDSAEGDHIRVNLPLGVVRVLTESDLLTVMQNEKLGGAIQSIDFAQLFFLVSKGAMGELITVDAADGTVVRIFVEAV